MKARVIATGVIVEISLSHIVYDNGKKIIWYNTPQGASFTEDELEFFDTEENFDYWTRLKHQYAGMAMQGLLSNPSITERVLTTRKGIIEDAERLAHTLVEKVRCEENPKELEGLKKELEALKIEKTILENKIKLLKEERK